MTRLNRLPPPLPAEKAIAIVQLWAQRSAARKNRRTAVPLIDVGDESVALIDRVLATILPWGVWEYPGKERALRAICGSGDKRSISRWRRTGLPIEPAEKLARFLESRIEREMRLVAALREVIRDRPNQWRPPGFVAATREDRLAWWDVRRQKAGERSAKRYPKAGDPK